MAKVLDITMLEKSLCGTSFHDVIISCSLNDLINILGKPQYSYNGPQYSYDGGNKINFEWGCETDNGDLFTIYNWKEHRQIPKTEIIEWHIGAYNKLIAIQAKIEVNEMLFRYSQ